MGVRERMYTRNYGVGRLETAELSLIWELSL